MNTRTIMIFPEFENIHVINNIRRKYDPLVDLVLPHITLAFPFDSGITNEEISLYLKESLRDIHPFKIELEGFSKQEEKTEKYLFLNVAQGVDVFKNIHDILYKDKLKQFNMGHNYVPHMTVGKVSSTELLNKALDDVNKHYNEKFSTVVKKISVEMIGEHQESIIVIEHELN
ncbi:2'-5' RNA ligase family protein [Clostridium sp. DL-VIII]|uniref:2'-5' RNA ligase family protein n=1 Tax=Clostridium sp. DL-VIII TaxID=641107 RepID=UPI00031ED1EE|nr:2'-5' RNA ligase family protein [Clostridium sp. DL-VIII]